MYAANAAIGSNHASSSPQLLPRRSSQHASLSSSSTVTLTRSTSVLSNGGSAARPSTAHGARDSIKPPKKETHKRRSSVAHIAIGSLEGLREGLGSLKGWSPSSASSSRSSRDHHQRNSSLSRKLAGVATNPLAPPNGSTAPASSSLDWLSEPPPPVKSPRKRNLHSPPPPPSSSRRVEAPPPISALPPPPPPKRSSSTFDQSPYYRPMLTTPQTTGSMSSLADSQTNMDYFSIKPRTGRSSPTSKRAPTQRDRTPPRSPSRQHSRHRSTSKDSSDVRASPSRMGQALSRDGDRRSRERGGAEQQARRTRGDSDLRRKDELPQAPSVSDSPRRDGKEKDRKTMLARALQKANTAVILDNEQNWEGAVAAYSEACHLLQEVTERSSGEEELRKLNAIRTTYTNRIRELQQLENDQPSNKSLPAIPANSSPPRPSRETSTLDTTDTSDAESTVFAPVTVPKLPIEKPVERRPSVSPAREGRQEPQRESILTSAFRGVEETIPKTSMLLSLPEESTMGSRPVERVLTYGSDMDRTYMPPPLSPRRPLSPNKLEGSNDSTSTTVNTTTTTTTTSATAGANLLNPSHIRLQSTDSTSWLDTIDESGPSSSASSVHSVGSQNELRRKHLRTGSGQTEAEFDAALDAAVEAAYDDGYEPYRPESDSFFTTDLPLVGLSSAIAKEEALQRAREDVIKAAKQREMDRIARGEPLPLVRSDTEMRYEDQDAEEERMLEEMTKEYMLDGFDFGLQSKSALPRESDGSTFSENTWLSSRSSHRTTVGTNATGVTDLSGSGIPYSGRKMSVTGTLTTVSEGTVAHDPALPPPTAAPPKIPASEDRQSVSVRNRRLSGLNAKQLKIETSISVPLGQRAPTSQPEASKTSAGLRADPVIAPLSAQPATGSSGLIPSAAFKSPGIPSSALQSSSFLPSGLQRSIIADATSPAETHVTISPATPLVAGAAEYGSILPPSPTKANRMAPPLKKNKSSLSLNKVSVSSPDGSDRSVSTPISTTFSTMSGYGRTRLGSASQPLPTPPGAPTFPVDGSATGGMNLFESDIHSPESPGIPNPLTPDAPIALEPCPESHLLRPFWLMRCVYQTICHPRGGYLSTRLFVPRDVWRVKGVKLKAIDDKISNCDLLTAALLKLTKTNTLDADAVMEEMQSLEAVLDQAQANLTKKLGNDVGVNGIQTLFKDAPAMGEPGQGGDGATGSSSGSGGNTLSKSSSSSSKSYLSSWRKLRQKNSNLALNGSFAATKEPPKDVLTMSSLPMTTLQSIRFARREVSKVDFLGPNAAYMGSLARLFDAVQILDQIARQVEDPGLRAISSTHVGLELSSRHAAEFFGFYICRFVLSDLALMLDKFIKRGSEWVLI